jgi:CRP-like cAMP-binding protein
MQYIYTVKYGIIKLCVVDENNKQITTALVSKGMLLGIESIDNNAYIQNAKTLTPVGLCKIKLTLEQIQENNILNKNIFSKWRETYEYQTKAFEYFTIGATSDKILRLFKYLSKYTFDDNSEYFYMLSLSDISSIVGVSKENCSRALSKIKKTKISIVDRKKGLYTIL